jgi:Saxitoxin biosynthesis operon protein SxtJ
MIDPHIPEASVDTTNRTLRQFAGLCVLAFGGLAGWQGLVQDHAILAMIFAGLAGLVGLLGLLRPQAVRPLFRGAMTATYPIGWVVSHVLLAFMFYGLVTPMALFFRLIGRDVLACRRRADQPSYWVPKRMPSDVRSYFRQS